MQTEIYSQKRSPLPEKADFLPMRGCLLSTSAIRTDKEAIAVKSWPAIGLAQTPQTMPIMASAALLKNPLSTLTIAPLKPTMLKWCAKY